MEKAYIILAHRNPMQLLKLITRLEDGKSTFFLHIDKKVSLQQFKPVIDYSSKIHLVNRERSDWGSLGLVKATLNGLQAVHDHKTFDRIILLSGQDYPIKSNEEIDHFYKSSKHSVFIEYTTVPDYKRWPSGGGMYRINKYFFGLKGYQLFSSKAMNLTSTIFPSLKRKIPKNLIFYAGSQWWTIDGYALEYILNFVKTNPRYTAFHKYTFAPDELYFQSILLNSKDQKLCKSIANNNLVYSKWLHSSAAHPKVLDETNINEILASDYLFARKFDQEIDTKVLYLIDEFLDAQQHAKVKV